MKKIISLLTVFSIILTSAVFMPFDTYAASKTGIGLAEWAMRAYNEEWEYVYAGASVGAVDCSGLVYSYAGGYHGSKGMLNKYASEQGKVSDGIPRIHGLVLYAPATSSSSVNHMGVFVGFNSNGEAMAVDARSSAADVVYKTVSSRKSKPWTIWFKHSKLKYPSTGWYTYNGKKYYYHNGEFVIGQFTVDGVTYDFGKNGVLKGEVSGSGQESAKTTTTKKTSSALRYGDKGDEVLKLQNRLVELGYLSGKQDGSYGNKTVAAVKNFQKTAGLTADGVAGPATQKALYESDAPKATTTAKTTTSTTTKTTTTKATTTTTTTKKTTTPKTTTPETSASVQALKIGSKGDKVYQLQQRLSSLGYLTVKYDGTYGEKTADAVKRFQIAAGLTPDGVAGPATQKALFASSAPKATTKTTTSKTTASTTTTTSTGTTTTPPADTSYSLSEFEVLKIGSNGDAVEQLQIRLAELGFFTEMPTGYFGSFTRDAVMDFQSFSALQIDGIVGESTFNAIFSDTAVSKPSEYSSELIYSDEEDGGYESDLSNEPITVFYNGECFVLTERIYDLIENSVFF